MSANTIVTAEELTINQVVRYWDRLTDDSYCATVREIHSQHRVVVDISWERGKVVDPEQSLRWEN